MPKVKGAIENELKKLKKLGKTNHKWIKTYEDFKGLNSIFFVRKYQVSLHLLLVLV
jgi:hypothetical protein